jgi:hypothetical protein
MKCRERRYFETRCREILHEFNNDNGVRVANFIISKNLTFRNTMFPHRSIHKYILTSPDGKTHNQIEHVLTGKMRHLIIVDVQSFRGADRDTTSYAMLVKVT